MLWAKAGIPQTIPTLQFKHVEFSLCVTPEILSSVTFTCWGSPQEMCNHLVNSYYWRCPPRLFCFNKAFPLPGWEVCWNMELKSIFSNLDISKVGPCKQCYFKINRTYLCVYKEWGYSKMQSLPSSKAEPVSAGLWLSPRSGSWKCDWEPTLSLLLFDSCAQATVDLTPGPPGSKNGFCTAQVAPVKCRIGNAVFVVVMICRRGGPLEKGKTGCHHLSGFLIWCKEKENHSLLFAAGYSSLLANGLNPHWCKLD